MSGIPEWLEPYLRQGAYNPTQEDISNLEPQSRQEMLLKFASLTGASELSNYYTKQEVDNLISTIPKFSIEVVSQLPTRDISETTVYLVPSQSEEDDVYIFRVEEQKGENFIMPIEDEAELDAAFEEFQKFMDENAGEDDK